MHATLLQGRQRFCPTLQRLTFWAFLHIAKQKMDKQIVRALPVPATAAILDILTLGQNQMTKKIYIKKVAQALLAYGGL